MHSPFLPGVKTASTHKDDTDASSSVIQFGSQSEVGGSVYQKASRHYGAVRTNGDLTPYLRNVGLMRPSGKMHLKTGKRDINTAVILYWLVVVVELFVNALCDAMFCL